MLAVRKDKVLTLTNEAGNALQVALHPTRKKLPAVVYLKPLRALRDANRCCRRGRHEAGHSPGRRAYGATPRRLADGLRNPWWRGIISQL